MRSIVNSIHYILQNIENFIELPYYAYLRSPLFKQYNPYIIDI